MAPLPVEIMAGVYLGLLVGIIPALAAWALGFIFKYFTGVTLPGFGVVVFAVALAASTAASWPSSIRPSRSRRTRRRSSRR